MFEIGNSLREARLRQQIELAEAEQGTKIRSKYLRALEDERFELLPAETYVKGFLRSYAEYLGLDGQLYVDEFNSRYVVGEEEEPARSRRSPAARQAQRRVESRALLAALAGIAAAFGLVIVAWKWGGSETQRIRVAPQPRAVAPAAPPKSSGADVADPRAPEWISLRIRAVRGDSWVTVKRGGPDGRVLFDEALERGSSTQALTGARLWLQIADARNVVATVGGARVRIPQTGFAPVTAVASRRGIVATSG